MPRGITQETIHKAIFLLEHARINVPAGESRLLNTKDLARLLIENKLLREGQIGPNGTNSMKSLCGEINRMSNFWISANYSGGKIVLTNFLEKAIPYRNKINPDSSTWNYSASSPFVRKSKAMKAASELFGG